MEWTPQVDDPKAQRVYDPEKLCECVLKSLVQSFGSFEKYYLSTTLISQPHFPFLHAEKRAPDGDAA